MKITITDPYLGKRVINDDPLSVLTDQLKVLNAMRDDGRVPSQLLLDDIRVYEYIVHGPDSKLRAEAYFRAIAKNRGMGKTLNKLQIAKNIGWPL